MSSSWHLGHLGWSAATKCSSSSLCLGASDSLLTFNRHVIKGFLDIDSSISTTRFAMVLLTKVTFSYTWRQKGDDSGRANVLLSDTFTSCANLMTLKPCLEPQVASSSRATFKGNKRSCMVDTCEKSTLHLQAKWCLSGYGKANFDGMSKRQNNNALNQRC